MLSWFVLLAGAAEPTPPASVTERPKLLEPVEHVMSERTKAKAKVPSMILFEWHGGTVPKVGTWIDLWTPTAAGVCSPHQRAEVVLGPEAVHPDLVHPAVVIRVPAEKRDVLTALKYLSWTERSADDPRTYETVACPGD